MRIKTARWNSTTSQKEWRDRGRGTLIVGGTGDPDPEPPVGEVLFAGHIPNRVLVGMATPADSTNSNPGWTEALGIIGQPIYEARRFVNWITLSSFNSMMAEAGQANAYPVISFKVPGNDWASVVAGNYNADLINLFNYAVARRTSGAGGTPQPFACSFHHEPSGDGDLSVWAAMQEYCTWYYAGRRGGTAASPYNAAHDITDIMAWAPIGNGFWWRTSTAGSADGNAAFPQSLIDALRINKGILLNDFYDCDYVNQQAALTDPSFRTPGSGVRTYRRIENFMVWARNKNTGAVGCGEFGVIDAAEMDRCFDVMFANRDIWAISNYFNSGLNSDHEWRLIPSNYPAGNPTGSKGLVDFGGNAQSQGRLDRFKVGLTASTSPQYTGPL